MTAPTPRPLTTIDFLKTIAVLLMIIDHIGFHFLVENTQSLSVGDPNMWWRSIGRWCVPIWFFLIGYARTRDIPASLWIGAGVLVVASMATGMFVFPLNVLFSMIFVRLMIDRVAFVAFGSIEGLLSVFVISLLLASFSGGIFEYGTLGILLALTGYAVRQGHQGETPHPVLRDSRRVSVFLWASVVAFIFVQWHWFSLMDTTQFGVMSAGVALVSAFLFYIPFTTYPALTARLGPVLSEAFRFFGTHTLWIYVGHLILFKVIALVFGLGYPIYGFFDWDWTVKAAFDNLPGR